jgi:hypothetical protein
VLVSPSTFARAIRELCLSALQSRLGFGPLCQKFRRFNVDQRIAGANA